MADRDLAKGIASTDLEEGRILAGVVDGQDVVLVRHRGRVCALAGTCTHLKAPLADGIVADGTIRCPWHHARFDVETGEAVGAPAFAPLERFTVVEEQGRVRVEGPAPRAEVVPAKAGRRIGRVVIIGGGGAGHACAEMLARHGADATVTLLSDEPGAPYDRTFCSKQYLAGKADRDDTALPLPGEGVTLRTGVAVTRIDRDAGAVVLGDGERVAYDILILATGSAAVPPDFYGANRDDVHVVRGLADADRLIAALAGAARAIIIGSSYVGLEVAASLVARGLEVAVVSDADLPLEKTAGPEVGAMIRDLHQSKGVTFHLNRRVARWDGHAATLDDGSRVEGDLLVAGIGATPRTELAEAAGLTLAAKEAGGGVQVDGCLRTSDPAIHAIGDIASVPDPRLGHPIRVEHWVVAQRMGQWLARHLMGEGKAEYTEVPFFWSGHYDLSLRYVGHVASTEDRAIDGDIPGRDFVVSFAEEGRERAVLTAGRDVLALEKEHGWERD
ncbi:MULTISPECIES: FAD-dependent oxidoreductase [unclassified Sphingomonas]|uniref:FAD-dependent oxidoreductase n=1 Tax=unclassified Sphingomonas TaxID=196159 RepID=UPI002863D4BB|nr:MULTISPECIES: FAD-dependent oxidoreductase [unclassified Sphingomonas]MDR6114753.1 NADPH-dependent 2,4-dienoyl-CoA reductase/sulfur reductase-like enzyme/nitrite reductase/ring-hydroxylating ferredoxin subunit [Sphingomonas sp. SORGH_AS_0789]MDR6151574.1 NADPH-dependent 2,4-dienoyl-CoA reductase/sulfur reductase-like enzyme/nitrite reductase/ring-hydroxylating ferredoxin subunit [Sphingomonas sp. SORGH_AS_0742]